MKEMQSLLNRDAPTVNGQSLGESISGAERYKPEVIADLKAPVSETAGIWVLHGNLAPKGAIIKPSAASPQLLKHRGHALVFDTIEDFKTRIDDPSLDVDESSVLVLRGCGPVGYPGMPEVGNMPLPRKLLDNGVRDMLRLSDARMSGTAFGTVVLHVAPEAEVGGPLALVRTGDEILFDGHARRLELLVDDRELAGRRSDWNRKQTGDRPTRGYLALHARHVLQADQGCDLEFLRERQRLDGRTGVALMSTSATYPSLAGRVVMITGGASGIGAAMVEAFVEQGARVGFVDIDEASAAQLGKRLGVDLWFRCVDVTDVPALKQAIADLAEQSGGLDVLVNNVANDTRHAALEVTEQQWRACLSSTSMRLFCIPGRRFDHAGSGWRKHRQLELRQRRARARTNARVRDGQGRSARADQGAGPRIRRGFNPREQRVAGLGRHGKTA